MIARSQDAHTNNKRKKQQQRSKMTARTQDSYTNTKRNKTRTQCYTKNQALMYKCRGKGNRKQTERHKRRIHIQIPRERKQDDDECKYKLL
jgi:hypothetical protein